MRKKCCVANVRAGRGVHIASFRIDERGVLLVEWAASRTLRSAHRFVPHRLEALLVEEGVLRRERPAWLRVVPHPRAKALLVEEGVRCVANARSG